MGCCMSSPARLEPPSLRHRPQNSPAKQLPASVEEETVKEVVLSETPISKPPPPPQPPKQTTPITHQKKTQHPIPLQPITPLAKTPEISQASEICSITDTVSTTTTATTATTTVTEIRDDEVTSKKRVPRKRPHTAKSPAKSERAPLRRDLSSEVKRTPQRNAGSIGGGGMRRERPPADRTAGGMGRGRTGGSPAKLRGRSGGRSAGVVGSAVNKEERNDGTVSRQQQPQEQEQGNESLEDQLVSLECFIFL